MKPSPKPTREKQGLTRRRLLGGGGALAAIGLAAILPGRRRPRKALRPEEARVGEARRPPRWIGHCW